MSYELESGVAVSAGTWSEVKINGEKWDVSSAGQHFNANMRVTIFEPDENGEVDIEVQGRVVHVPFVALAHFVDANRRRMQEEETS